MSKKTKGNGVYNLPMNDKEYNEYVKFVRECEKHSINKKDPDAKKKLRRKQIKKSLKTFGIVGSHVAFKIFLVILAALAFNIDCFFASVALMFTMLMLVDLYGAHRFDWFPTDFDSKYVKRYKKHEDHEDKKEEK